MSEQKPEMKIVRGCCNVSVFCNETEKNGETIKIKKAVFQKRYKDKNGNWQNTQSLDINDIPKAIVCLSRAYDYLTQNVKSNDSE